MLRQENKFARKKKECKEEREEARTGRFTQTKIEWK